MKAETENLKLSLVYRKKVEKAMQIIENQVDNEKRVRPISYLTLL